MQHNLKNRLQHISEIRNILIKAIIPLTAAFFASNVFATSTTNYEPTSITVINTITTSSRTASYRSDVSR